MSEHPLVSVVMPCYNAEKYFVEAIESIVNQTYRNLEIVMINDGSTDRTLEMIMEYAANDSRIKFINIAKNSGLINSLNEGIAFATGEYIARMDADDISAPDRIEKMIKAFVENEDVGLICAGNYAINPEGKIILKNVPKALRTKALKFVSLFITPFVHGCVMAKSYLFKENAFSSDYIHSEDYELYSRLIFKGVKMLNLVEPLYYLRLNPDSVSVKYESIQVNTHGKISRQNIENYFNISPDLILLRIMINRINFNVLPSLIKDAFNQLDQLKTIFIQREQCSEQDIEEIEMFLVEQKIDIIFQSFKASSILNKIFIVLFMMIHLPLFFNKRGYNYIKSKVYSKTKFFHLTYNYAYRISQEALVSVVMPCYNAEAYFRNAIESIINQSYKNLEIVVVNDGSTDRTLELIEEYAEKDSRIKIINMPVNSGAVNSINKGVVFARGEYIARMDADDISALDRIEKMIKVFFEKKEIELISSANYMINVEGKILLRKFPKATRMKALKFVSLFVTPVVGGCVVAKSYVFKENPYDPDYVSEDYELFSRLVLKGIKMLNLTEPLYFVRINPTSTSFKYEKMQVTSHEKISKQNIENYFNISLDLFLLRVMMNRISFNVSPVLIKNAFKQLEVLKTTFIQNEQCIEKDVKEIDLFLVEQKIDILFQSFKASALTNKIFIFIFMLAHLDVFGNKRGFNYIKSKIHSKTKV